MNEPDRGGPATADGPRRPRGPQGQAEAADRLRHGSSFGAAAAAYAEHRPDYAEAAVRWALEPVWDRPAGPGGRHRRGNRQADRDAGPPRRRGDRGGTGPADAGRAAAGDARGAFGAGKRGRDAAARCQRRTPSWPARPCTGSTWTARCPRSPGCSRPAGCSPGCGTWTTTGWAGSPTWPRSASASPASRCCDGATARAGPGGSGWSRRARGLFRAAEEGEFGHGQARTADSLLATIAHALSPAGHG